MTSPIKDLSIFNEFKFELQPIGIKFLLFKPEGMEKLDKNLSVCEMIREAQEGNSFYAMQDNFTCVGTILTGMVESDPIFESGQIGPNLHIFEEARANRRLYYDITTLGKNSVRYVAFSPLDKLNFDPDVLILASDPTRLEIILFVADHVSLHQRGDKLHYHGFISRDEGQAGVPARHHTRVNPLRQDKRSGRRPEKDRLVSRDVYGRERSPRPQVRGNDILPPRETTVRAGLIERVTRDNRRRD
jgi:hypothetical protein